MFPSTSYKLLSGSMIVGACVILCLAILAKAQYNTYDSDSNSDSEGGPILTQAELGKLVRNSGRHNAQHQNRLSQQQAAAATRNLYNRQQPLQYAPSYNKRSNSYGSDSLNNYGPMGAESTGRGSNQNSDADDEGDSSFGPNFGSNFDNNGNDGENEGSNAAGEGQTMNLNQAASGYPGQGDYNNDAALGNSGFGGFGGASGYGPSSNDGSEFGPSDGFSSGEGRRAKSASSPMGSRGFGGSDEDAGAPLYGPNSAVNGDNDDEGGRAGYAPEGGNDNENDDE